MKTSTGTPVQWLTETGMLSDPPRRREVSVPCGDCSYCCRNSPEILVNTNDLLRLQGTGLQTHLGKDGRYLDLTEQGHCPAVTDRGCSIHDQRPEACRRFDCRAMALTAQVPSDEWDDVLCRWKIPLETDLDRVALRELVQAADTAPEGVNPVTYAVVTAGLRIRRLQHLAEYRQGDQDHGIVA